MANGAGKIALASTIGGLLGTMEERSMMAQLRPMAEEAARRFESLATPEAMQAAQLWRQNPKAAYGIAQMQYGDPQKMFATFQGQAVMRNSLDLLREAESRGESLPMSEIAERLGSVFANDDPQAALDYMQDLFESTKDPTGEIAALEQALGLEKQVADLESTRASTVSTRAGTQRPAEIEARQAKARADIAEAQERRRRVGKPDFDFTDARAEGQIFRKNQGAFTEIKDAWRRAIANAENVNRNPVAQQALIVILNKMLDPGSVVRESEFDRIFTTQGVYQRAKVWVKRLASGDQIEASTIGQIYEVASKIMEVETRALKAAEAENRQDFTSFGVDANLAEVATPDLLLDFRESVVGEDPKGTKRAKLEELIRQGGGVVQGGGPAAATPQEDETVRRLREQGFNVVE